MCLCGFDAVREVCAASVSQLAAFCIPVNKMVKTVVLIIIIYRLPIQQVAIWNLSQSVFPVYC